MSEPIIESVLLEHSVEQSLEIRRLRERVRELESQLRTARVDNDAIQLRNAKYLEHIAALKEADRWIPVQERLPDCTREFYQIYGPYVGVETAELMSGWWKCTVTGHQIAEVTHWRQLPPNPSEIPNSSSTPEIPDNSESEEG